VRVRLDERILHGFVGISRIPQVVERDAHGTTLMATHELGEPISRLAVASIGLQCLDC
jgi:hypothetical protein